MLGLVKDKRVFFSPSLTSFLTEFRLGFSSIKKLSRLNSSVNVEVKQVGLDASVLYSLTEMPT